MVKEVLEYLKPVPGCVVVDCTVGAGGHAGRILERISPEGRLIGIDSDKEILEIAGQALKDFQGRFVLRQGNFRELDAILGALDVDKVDGVLFDLGVSSYQLASARRGFSFNVDGPLDMRMGEGPKTCRQLVNRLSKDELADIFFNFGEERYARRIAEAITRGRRGRPIETTSQLKDIILRAVPKSRSWHRLHPATRVFQALRIAVNDELAALDEALDEAVGILKPGGRICVISFHSLEDRIVKNKFKGFGRKGILKILTKKPVYPGQQEVKVNPRARSARLRAALRTPGEET
jgi:16S rRNA (cytosine1402-N4)-methyltransferase